MGGVISSLFSTVTSKFLLSDPGLYNSLFSPNEVFALMPTYCQASIYFLIPVLFIFFCKCFTSFFYSFKNYFPSPTKNVYFCPAFEYIIDFTLASCFYVLLFFSVTFSLIFNYIAIFVSYPVKYYSPNKHKYFIEHFTSKCYNLAAFTIISLYPFWSVHVIRPPPKGYNASRTVIMCNHSSSADGFILLSKLFPWSSKVVYKSCLQKIAIFGRSLMVSGQVPIYFTKEKNGWGTEAGSVRRTMERCKELVDLECSILVFPQGTRAGSSNLSELKNGFFKFSIENECDILPMIMYDTAKAWPLHSVAPKICTIYVVFGTPVNAKGYELEDLKDVVRKQMSDLLKLCPDFKETTNSAEKLPVRISRDAIF